MKRNVYMDYFIIDIECMDYENKQKKEYGKAYLADISGEEEICNKIGEKGEIPTNLIVQLLEQFNLTPEDLLNLQIHIAKVNFHPKQIYMLPKSMPNELIKPFMQQYLNIKAAYYGTVPDDEGYGEDEYEDDFYESEECEEDDALYLPEDEEDEPVYCYAFGHYSELKHVPVTNGSVIKDENGQKYLMTSNVLHDFLKSSSIPEEQYLVADDITEIL